MQTSLFSPRVIWRSGWQSQPMPTGLWNLNSWLFRGKGLDLQFEILRSANTHVEKELLMLQFVKLAEAKTSQGQTNGSLQLITLQTTTDHPGHWEFYHRKPASTSWHCTAHWRILMINLGKLKGKKSFTHSQIGPGRESAPPTGSILGDIFIFSYN